MRVFLVVILCAVALKDVIAESENEVKRGTFPFMAFIYYPDETILDNNGARFTKGAVLISNNWLISSSDVSIGFPNKTLLARLGAVNIDSNLTFNEDEEEQEGEIILIIRPSNYSATEWWNADISLLKTLLPFNATTSVAPAALVSNPDNTEKTCFILIYAKRYGNATERSLMQMSVELLPSTEENCGNNFRKETMGCSTDSDDKLNAIAGPQFCQGNSGGPLICDNELTGLQTYITDCKQPYLYQLLTVWKNLISCATREQYLLEPCGDICVVLTKDTEVPPLQEIDYAITPKLSEAISKILSDNDVIRPDTEASPKIMEEESILTSESGTSKPTMTEINEEQMTNNTSSLTQTYSHDTSSLASSELFPNTEEDAVYTIDERERKNHVEAQHHLVRSNASIIVPLAFHYLLTFISVLAYLT